MHPLREEQAPPLRVGDSIFIILWRVVEDVDPYGFVLQFTFVALDFNC